MFRFRYIIDIFFLLFILCVISFYWIKMIKLWEWCHFCSSLADDNKLLNWIENTEYLCSIVQAWLCSCLLWLAWLSLHCNSHCSPDSGTNTLCVTGSVRAPLSQLHQATHPPLPPSPPPADITPDWTDQQTHELTNCQRYSNIWAR